MSDTKTPFATADWTKLLNDPELISHLGELLKVYREAPEDKRDAVLLEAMRKIKGGAAVPVASTAVAPAASGENSPLPVVTTDASHGVKGPDPANTCPPAPDTATPWGGADRRRHPRLKCYVAVELRFEGSEAPIWGNLANASMGGAFIELASPVPPGGSAEIGLWLATGKIWVKGLVLNGVVTSSSPSYGARIKFSELQEGDRESLKQFLKFVETETRGYETDHGYLARLRP